VKLEVFRPTWLEERRVQFTLAAARALADLLPERASATISTLAGSCKRFGDDAGVHASIARNLARLAVDLARLREESGREIVVALEPEPFTTLETADEAVAFFERQVYAGRGRDETDVRRHVGACFDCCHQAVQFEDARASLARIVGAGVRVAKMQLSSALSVRAPAADAARLAALARFAEPRYLHQVVATSEDGARRAFLDLPDFLAQPRPWLERVVEARTHFHVPIDRAELPPLSTTRAFLEEAVAAARALDATSTFEVETYTFPVLPGGPGGDAELVDALRRELLSANALFQGESRPDSSRRVEPEH